MAKVVNQTELAEIHGVSDVTLWQWQKEGMPVLEVSTRGLPNKYDVAATIEWREARAVKKVREESPRDMLYRVQTQLTQLQIAEKTRELVRADEIEPQYAKLILASRQKLLQLRDWLRNMLGAIPGTESAVARVDEGFDAALQELANYEPGASADPESGAALVAAIPEDGGGVGAGEALPQREELRIPG